MTEHEEHQIHQKLQSWKLEIESDPDFKHKVHHRIHEQFFTQEHQSDQSIGEWIHQLLNHPIFATTSILTIVLLTVLTTLHFHQDRANHPSNVPDSYQAVINPAQTARLMLAGTAGFDSLSEQPAISKQSFEEAMVWIVKQMDLNPGQADGFQQVHERFFSKYELLCSQLIHLENEYRQFERDRIAGKTIDLFSVYSNFQQQKLIYQQTIQLQQELIHEVSDLLTPQQQGAYGQLFHNKPNPTNDSPSAQIQIPTREWQI